jgi:hypothetical protein
MEMIMQYSAGAITALSTLAFAGTILVGAWLAAKFGKITLVPAVVLFAGAFWLRFSAFPEPLSLEAMAATTVFHLFGGVVLGLMFLRSKRFGRG